DRTQQRTVDCPPPVGKGIAFFAGKHLAVPGLKGKPHWWPMLVSEGLRECLSISERPPRPPLVMPGPDRGVHAFLKARHDVDGRDKPGHDGRSSSYHRLHT